MLKVRRSVWMQPVEICVEGEVGELLPRGLVALDLHRVHAHRGLVSNGGSGNHGNPVHGTVAHLATVLVKENGEYYHIN